VIPGNSFSKILAPGLRQGWLHTNPAIIQRNFTCGVLDRDGRMNPFTSSIVSSLIENGALDKNISNLANILGRRIQVMDASLREHLPQAQYVTPHGGYFFWVRIPGMDAEDLQKKAATYNVGLRPGIRFSSRNGLND